MIESIKVEDQINVDKYNFIEILTVDFCVEIDTDFENRESRYINAISATGSIASSLDGDSFVYGVIDLHEFSTIRHRVEAIIEKKLREEEISFLATLY